MRDPKTGASVLFALNRSTDQAMTLEAELRGVKASKITSASELHHADLKAINSKQAPNAVAPITNETATLKGETLRATLKPQSWNVIALS